MTEAKIERAVGGFIITYINADSRIIREVCFSPEEAVQILDRLIQGMWQN